MAKRRTIRIVAIERTRIVETPPIGHCPICSSARGFLSVGHAASLGSETEFILWRRLSEGTAHGIQTPNGTFWICHESLLLDPQKPD
ncbi:MAG TPA: hypothetical protein VIX17_01305 [Pyrinomonadaceae bacterium]|jgi:hypothetical protein